MAVAACSSSGGSGTGSGTTGAAAGAGSGSGTAIGTHHGADGTYLTGASGKTVYLWAADMSTKSTCTGPCAAAWPPVTTNGAPRAAAGVTASALGTTTRSDGSVQVTYDGHPLYYYAGDSGSGETTGQGSNQFGAKWWLVAPSGSAITGSGAAASGGASSPAPSSHSSSSSGGGGWG
ncbi:MAG: hypothetical protein EPN43_12700 [Jatrophihabitans sp.]|nr:MAG: hypothetical protein EPN43_12700 [Jatrophihabitans sp.]